MGVPPMPNNLKPKTNPPHNPPIPIDQHHPSTTSCLRDFVVHRFSHGHPVNVHQPSVSAPLIASAAKLLSPSVPSVPPW